MRKIIGIIKKNLTNDIGIIEKKTHICLKFKEGTCPNGAQCPEQHRFCFGC